MTSKKQQPPKRRCRLCGKPEKKAYWGYSNLTPYSQICVECLNKQIQQTEKEHRD